MASSNRGFADEMFQTPPRQTRGVSPRAPRRARRNEHAIRQMENGDLGREEYAEEDFSTPTRQRVSVRTPRAPRRRPRADMEGERAWFMDDLEAIEPRSPDHNIFKCAIAYLIAEKPGRPLFLTLNRIAHKMGMPCRGLTLGDMYVCISQRCNFTPETLKALFQLVGGNEAESLEALRTSAPEIEDAIDAILRR